MRKLRGGLSPEERVVIETAPGEEAQDDFGEGLLIEHEPVHAAWQVDFSVQVTLLPSFVLVQVVRCAGG